MDLKNISTTLLPELMKNNFGNELMLALDDSKAISAKAYAGSSPSILAAQIYLVHQKNVVFIVENKEEALYATTELEELVGKEKVFYFPPSHLEPYQIEKIQNANLVLRTEVLNRLNSGKSPKIIVTPYGALAERVLKKADFTSISHTIKVGDQLDFDFVNELLQMNKFHRTDFVSEPGEFSIRGGIVDLFSYSNERPYRITFFGNEVESIKTFNIETQLSLEKVEQFQLVSNMNTATTESKIPFFDLLPKDSIIITNNAVIGAKQIKDFYEKAEKNFEKLSKDIQHQKPEKLFLTEINFLEKLAALQHIDFAVQPLQELNPKIIELNQKPQPSFHKNFEMLADDLKKMKEEGYETFISFTSIKQRDRLESILGELNHEVSFRSFQSELHSGFIDHTHKISVYTDHQIFDRYQRFQAKASFAKSEQLTLKDMMSLKIGNYITHIDHGIGKFLGLVKITNNGKTQECFKLTYKNGDLLYVSIHALHKISKYNGPENKEIVLSKLGSPAWKSLKAKTKSKVKLLAFDLIKLYAQRKTAKGFAYAPDTYLQNELEASFIYEDTPDQEKATIDVKKDMEDEGVMDRLICGDVGFGKTEIAIRAAFKAATEGKQTAILVPTTVLAFQHYRSFTERLKDFPVNVGYLNRFRTAKQKKETLEKLAAGSIEIVIGTHQLVSEKVKFKDLGLLIIDEEHKFGVNVKDKLKTIKANVDTLTLTATPIPRTLQFSLMAARDLSVIKTPPPNRQPIETHIVNWDEELIRDAVSYELARDGQVYFINNRIENLKDIAGLIQRLVPDARIITGHGRMDGKELEKNVLDFMEGKYDVLVSTTIVESGVDVPNANTIFINDAQRFGMADVHQMRGRVGRSNRKAFCYLVTPPFDMVTPDARKRLEAIEQFSDLGSGFQIAMKDLEIRGAGDLLGGEQSGFINEMGFETYQKIMQEALEELQHDEEFTDLFENEEDRKKLFKSTKDVNVDTDLELMLPDDYVQNIEERLSLYQKLADIEGKPGLELIENELKDRFGPLPSEAKNLLKSVELKWLAADIGFDRIVVKSGIFLGYFPPNPQDKFYQSEKWRSIITYLSLHPKEATLKEKNTKEGNQLMMRKENVQNVDEVTQVLERILAG